MQAERHSSFGGGVDRQSSRIGRGQVRLGWLLRYAFAVVVDVGEARVLPGEKKALLNRVASDL